MSEQRSASGKGIPGIHPSKYAERRKELEEQTGRRESVPRFAGYVERPELRFTMSVKVRGRNRQVRHLTAADLAWLRADRVKNATAWLDEVQALLDEHAATKLSELERDGVKIPDPRDVPRPRS